MLIHYIYVNDELIDEYSSQLGFKEERTLVKVTKKASLSLSGPKLESNREYNYDDPNRHKKISRFVETLLAEDLVFLQRPNEMTLSYLSDNPQRAFGLEVIRATKVTFLKNHLAQLSCVREFAVWIADPDPSDLTTEKWKYRGTFLILPQLHFDVQTFHSVHSGCSALQAVVNGYQGKPLILGANGEPLGQGSYDHPVEKLRQLGAVVSPPQEIRVLYRIRYMSNEQCYMLNGVKYRANDLMAYPLFIAAEQKGKTSNKAMQPTGGAGG